jgi:histone acetyltransferase (RNA polymerase elongator complex component)
MRLVIPLFIPHRGCPHHCLFCNQEGIAGPGDDHGSDALAAEIERWLGFARSGAHVQVAFYGGSFTCLPEDEQRRLLAVVRPYRDAGRVHGIRLSTRPDCLDGETCRLLRAQGVETVELGVQSLNDRALQDSGRGHDAAQSRRAIRLLQDHGFEVGVQLLVGLPGETRASFRRGIEEVARLRPSLARLYPLLIVEGSGLAERYRRGLYRPLSLAEAVALCADAHRRLTAAGVRVVRLGLQPGPALAESFIAGPFHPAFGELVHGRLLFGELRRRLARLRPGQHLFVHISHRDHGRVAGVSGVNVRRLGELGFAGRYTILPEKDRARGSMDYVVS